MDSTTQKKYIRVVACVIEEAGRFLITQRKKQSHLGHLWEFPGGKIEAGESLEDCAIRECEEELGIVVKPLRLLEETKHDYPEASVHLYFMLCQHSSGTPQAIDCADFIWATPQEFHNYEFPAADEKVIENYIHGKPLATATMG